MSYCATKIISKSQISLELVINGDQTGLLIFATGKKTRVLEGTKK